MAAGIKVGEFFSNRRLSSLRAQKGIGSESVSNLFRLGMMLLRRKSLTNRVFVDAS